jgi:hypothetical protein
MDLSQIVANIPSSTRISSHPFSPPQKKSPGLVAMAGASQSHSRVMEVIGHDRSYLGTCQIAATHADGTRQ